MKEELKWKRMKTSRNPGGQTGAHICLSPSQTLRVQVACRRICHLCHGADHTPAPGSGEVEGEAVGLAAALPTSDPTQQQRCEQGAIVPSTSACLPSVNGLFLYLFSNPM